MNWPDWLHRKLPGNYCSPKFWQFNQKLFSLNEKAVCSMYYNRGKTSRIKRNKCLFEWMFFFCFSNDLPVSWKWFRLKLLWSHLHYIELVHVSERKVCSCKYKFHLNLLRYHFSLMYRVDNLIFLFTYYFYTCSLQTRHTSNIWNLINRKLMEIKQRNINLH